MTAVAEREYAKLVSERPPRVLRKRKEYNATLHELSALMRLGDRRSEAQTEYYDLLATLIKVYDDEHVRPLPKLAPLEFLKEAMEMLGITQAQISHVIGRQAASAILRGARDVK